MLVTVDFTFGQFSFSWVWFAFLIKCTSTSPVSKIVNHLVNERTENDRLLKRMATSYN